MSGSASSPVPALAYDHLVGRPRPGDVVLLNTSAWDRGLGTGGFALVVALPERLPDDEDEPGHLVKGRYTPLQAMVEGVDEQGTEHHDLLAEADDLAGLPVIVADLHSALPAVVAGVHRERPSSRIAYLMTDGGALPAWFSRSAAALRRSGDIVGTVTVGQAFGGDLEAVTLHTGLLAARLVLAADVVIVAQGPGNLGTETRWGFSGVSVGEAINAASILGGRPVAALRISGVDARSRHHGVSHHSMTAIGRVALAAADVVIPADGIDVGLADLIDRQVKTLPARHRLVRVPSDGLLEALRGSAVPLSSMGRGLEADPAYFLACAAAGRHAARLSAQAQPPGDPQ